MTKIINSIKEPTNRPSQEGKRTGSPPLARDGTRSRPESSPNETSSESSKEELQRLKETAFQQGLKKAEESVKVDLDKKIVELEKIYEENQSALKTEYEEKLSSLSILTQKLDNFLNNQHREFDAALISLTMACLNKLIGEDKISREYLHKVVENIEHDHQLDKRVSITVSKDCYRILENAQSPNLKILCDEALPIGTCIIESGYSKYDMSLKTVTTQIEATLESVQSE